MKRLQPVLFVLALLGLIFAGCDSSPSGSEHEATGSQFVADEAIAGKHAKASNELDGVYTFEGGPVFDIEAAANGNILVPLTVFSPADAQPQPGTNTSTIYEIRRQGSGGVREVSEVTTVTGSAVNGLAAVGAGSFFVTGAGLDRAVGGAVFHVSRGGQRLLGDVETFETEYDPDAFEGLEWKKQLCEGYSIFTAGPQTNPYHLDLRTGGEALVADAAGNTLLSVTTGGALDWVAIFPPATADGSDGANSDDWLPFIPDPAQCFVQPVPTSVAIGPDGDYYVGELTGLTLNDFDPSTPPTTGISRIWRIEAGAQNITCPSNECTLLRSGFTSIIDVEFGPGGDLFVVEYDENGWATATDVIAGATAGGTINRCDVSDPNSVSCTPVDQEGAFVLPAAITFDKWGSLWVLENNLVNPTVRLVNY